MNPRILVPAALVFAVAAGLFYVATRPEPVAPPPVVIAKPLVGQKRLKRRIPDRHAARRTLQKITANTRGPTADPLSATAPKDRPNVVLVVIDTLRAHYLELHGYPQSTAPFINSVANEGAHFTRAFSTSSWTAPATASIFTGQYPWTHGLVRGLQAEALTVESRTLDVIPMSRERDTLPQHFSKGGYSTVGWAANINVGKELGFARGFQRFYRERQATAEDLNSLLKEWKPHLNAATPYFLYLHLNDAHAPYTTHEEWFKAARTDAEDQRASYISEIGYLDHHLGLIYKELGLSDNTIFMVVSDHGEAFREHGRSGHPPNLYDELQRALFFVRAPGVRAQAIDVNVSLADVAPTLLEMAGLPPMRDADGTSLVSLMSGSGAARTELAGRQVLAHRMGKNRRHVFSAIQSTWKYIDHDRKRPQLYDHKSDPTEINNVAPQNAEIIAPLAASIKTALKTLENNKREVESLELDRGTQMHLKELGYVH